ncbi:MAG: TolB family protein, partial [Sodaliphilus sp.]
LNQVSEALGAGYKMNWQDSQTIVSTPYTMENGLRMVRIENVNVETAEISEVAPAQRGFRPSKVMKNVNLLRIMCDQPAEATRLIPSLEQYAGKMVLNPALSPDGKKIAFQIVSYGLFVCDVDGANLKSFGKGAYPSWAPNSRDLMFARIQDNGERFTASDLFSVNTETGVEENLTPNSDVIPITLSVSPDGSKVAFDNDVDGNIYVVDLK